MPPNGQTLLFTDMQVFHDVFGLVLDKGFALLHFVN